MTKTLLVVSFFLCALSAISYQAHSQTLAVGDIAIIGYNSDDVATNDDFCFVALVTIPANTVIHFTDFGWCSGIDFTGFQKPVTCGPSTGAASDGAITWTATSQVNAGTQVRIQCKNLLTATTGTVTGLQATYNVPSDYLSLATGGDQIFAFQGSLASPTIITGINMDGNWAASMGQCQFTSSISTRPATLNSTNSIAITPEIDNAVYNCVVTSGTPAELRAAIYNLANWTVHDVIPFPLPLSATFTSGSCAAPAVTANPQNRNICAGNNTTFTLSASGTGLTYQWQANTGSGFTNLANIAPYSTTTTSTLTVTGASVGMNGNAYRCVVTGTCGSANSTAGTLAIVSLNASVVTNNAACTGISNGSATVSISGGSPTYAYQWTPTGGTAAAAINLAAGDYSVLITDGNGCTTTRPVTIGANSGSNTGALAALPGAGMVTQTQPVATEGATYSDGNCNLVTTVQPSGASPVTGNVTTKVWVESSVPTVGNKPYVARHYEITPAVSPATATGTVTLYFLQSEFDNFNAAAGSVLDLPAHPADAAGIGNLRIAKYSGTSNDNSGSPSSYTNGSTVINPDDSHIIWNGISGRWEVSFPVAGFSGFIAQTSTFTLPVTWVYFHTEDRGGKVLLKWQTGAEWNCKEFIIEHSVDGRSFSAIGSLSCTGNTTSATDYSFLHEGPGGKDNYYRIREVDADGKILLSDVRKINMSSVEKVFSILTNPVVGGRLEVQFYQNSLASIYNSTGQVVRREAVVKGARVIECGELKQGTYILKSGNVSKRFIIQ
jgi:hypothetical protein